MAKTKLPKINPSRLQRTVADVEFNNDISDFDALCEAVADHSWSKKLNLDAWTLGALMIQHDTITTMDKPDAMPETETPPKPKHEPQPTSEIKTYDEAGRGRKQCPSCKKYLGNRNKICACGHNFDKPKPTETKPRPKHGPRSVGAAAVLEPPQEYKQGRRVARTVNQRTVIPAPSRSPCPHELKSTDLAAVEEWAEKVRASCQREYGQWMLVSALRYYAREYFDVFSKEYDTVRKHLATIYAGEPEAAEDD